MAIPAARRKPVIICEPVIDRITLEGALSELPAQFRTVSAFDEMYTKYLRTYGEQQSIRFRDGGLGLTGAMGVFGASARASMPVVLVPKQALPSLDTPSRGSA